MFSTMKYLLFVPSLVVLTVALNPSCAPGGNFDLSVWELELPIGPSQGDPTTIPSSQLQGCGGYQDPGHQYFFTESGDGALVMKSPSFSNSDCIKYSGSEHCRTELHEVNPSTGSDAVSWSSASPNINRLWMELTGESLGDVCIGQVFQADGNPAHNKPLAEIYYESNGDITIGVETVATGGNQNVTWIANVPLGTQFTYEVRYEDDTLKIQVNNAGLVHLETYFTPSGNFFKAGNYNQGSDEADIHVFGLVITH